MAWYWILILAVAGWFVAGFIAAVLVGKLFKRRGDEQ